MLGYKKRIFMLPFDHRHSFVKSFGFPENLSKDQKKTISYYKEIIYKGFLLARKKLKNKSELCILVDEYFGSSVIKQSKKDKILLAISTEASGEKYFEFEYGNNFSHPIKRINPDFVKVLIRYDLKNKKENIDQLTKIKKINDFCKKEKRIFLIELLTPILENKAKDTATIISEFQNFGIDPDIWKIEAYDKKSDWKIIIGQIKNSNERKNVGIIMLGRGEDLNYVKKWIKIAKTFKDINGFAVGRTIFLDALLKLHNGKIDQEKAIQIVASRYLEIVALWKN